MATRLASLGAHVVLVCRDHTRGEAVASEINGTAGTERATVMTADTSDQTSIRTFARDYRDTYGALEVLVNNAGVLLTGAEDDRRRHRAHLRHQRPRLQPRHHGAARRAEGRCADPCTNVASTFAFAVDTDDLQFERRPYDGLTAYGQSKALDRMLTWVFARRPLRTVAAWDSRSACCRDEAAAPMS